MIDLKNEEIRAVVCDHYGLIARGDQKSCCNTTGCCGDSQGQSLQLGYGVQELGTLSDGANLGLGCGNPQAIAALAAGETALDLGSGAGIDCFLASKAVGPSGFVLGVDMTYDMLNRARKNAQKGGYSNVEFRLGEIEHLPVADATVDVILSNCVINLSPDKAQVFREAFRVLKRGGRLAISDMVASGPLPDALKHDLVKHSQCISGATPLGELEAYLTSAGFLQVRIQPKAESRSFVKDWAQGTGIEDFILSATIEAVKPA